MNMPIYSPMQFIGPPKNSNYSCSTSRMVVQLTQLGFMHLMHYYYSLNITK